MRRTPADILAEYLEPHVHVLDPDKAARMAAKTMLIPSSRQVMEFIGNIPYGSSVTLKALRTQLAADSNADTTCPFAAGQIWKALAEVSELEGPDLPWWRVTVDGKPSPKTPGGIEMHRVRLMEEGVTI